MEQCCTHRFGCNYRFSCPSDKERYNYSLPSSQETIQLLQDSAEMGMKYRVRCYNLQKRKKNLKLWKISRIHLKLRAKNIQSKRIPWSLLIDSASQIPGEIFQRIGERRKSSVKSNTESNHHAGSKNIYIDSTPLLGACLQVS